MLDGSEAHHACKVLRLKKGDAIMVVDGVGNGYKAEIVRISDRKINCSIISRIRHYGEPLHYVTLAAGLSTGYKFDDVVQRATELGVSRIIPMVTEKSKVRIENDKREKTKLARWRKVAIASMKQTGRSLLPAIEPVMEYGWILDNHGDLGTKILLDLTYGKKNLCDLELPPDQKFFTIFVGPESGFTRPEIELAKEHDCSIVTLGKRVLRTENASPVAVALIMHLLGELR